LLPGRVSQIEHGEVSTVEALASYIAALGGKLLRRYYPYEESLESVGIIGPAGKTAKPGM
jgi:hypothetical protein